jgi:hypothetical protein
MSAAPTTLPVDSSMTALVQPTLVSSIVLNGAVIAELVRYLDMTAEFLRLASPRVRTELSAYLSDFHPNIGRDDLIDLLGNRAVELHRHAHQQSQQVADSTGDSSCPA